MLWEVIESDSSTSQTHQINELVELQLVELRTLRMNELVELWTCRTNKLVELWTCRTNKLVELWTCRTNKLVELWTHRILTSLNLTQPTPLFEQVGQVCSFHEFINLSLFVKRVRSFNEFIIRRVWFDEFGFDEFSYPHFHSSYNLTYFVFVVSWLTVCNPFSMAFIYFVCSVIFTCRLL